MSEIEETATAQQLPWCNLPICPEGDGGHRITAGRCIVVPARETLANRLDKL